MTGHTFLQLWKPGFQSLADLLFPPACLGCHRRIHRSEYPLCEFCAELVVLLNEEKLCHICGSPLQEGECELCSEGTIHFDLCRALFRFDGPIQQMIHELKYNSMRSTAKYFAGKAAEYIQSHDDFCGSHLILPVPLHPVRKRERGFNQSELIAKEIARILQIEYAEPVFRKHYTKSQTRLSKQLRMKNLHSAFGLRPGYDLKQKHLLLIDDVFTTGSTVNEIAKTLKMAEPEKINVITIARA